MTYASGRSGVSEYGSSIQLELLHFQSSELRARGPWEVIGRNPAMKANSW